MDKISPEEKIQWMKKILQKKESILSLIHILLQHKRIKISQKQLLKPKSFPHPQPEEQEFWQFVAAKSLMGNTPVF